MASTWAGLWCSLAGAAGLGWGGKKERCSEFVSDQDPYADGVTGHQEGKEEDYKTMSGKVASGLGFLGEMEGLHRHEGTL